MSTRRMTLEVCKKCGNKERLHAKGLCRKCYSSLHKSKASTYEYMKEYWKKNPDKYKRSLEKRKEKRK